MSIQISFNEEWVRSVSKKEFLENEKYHADNIDLSAEYDRINPPKKAKEKPVVDDQPADEK